MSTAATCTALKDEWINTMETTTTFPAVEETVLEVTCSDAGAIKKGSSKVTCILGTDFSYSDEPSCSRPGRVKKNTLEEEREKNIINDNALIKFWTLLILKQIFNN